MNIPTCESCDNNIQKFPKIQCQKFPYGEVETDHSICNKYYRQPDGDVLIFLKFPCGHKIRYEHSPGHEKIYCETTYKGVHPTKGSIISYRPDKVTVYKVYNFVRDSLKGNSKVFMNPELKELLDGSIQTTQG